MRTPLRLRKWLARQLMPELDKLRTDAERQANIALMSRMKQCGEGCGLWGAVHITGVEEMSLGRNVHSGGGAFIRAEGGLSIGDNTHISRNLVLYTINHRRDGLRIPYDETYEKRSVVIHPNVWIGMNVCIVPGTVVGEGAIIGMGTVLSGEIPPMSVVVGSRWRVVGTRDAAHYEDCVKRQAFGGPNGMRLAGEITPP